jgi:hypothetical protein
MLSDHIRKDYGSDDYRRVYNECLEKLVSLQKRLDQLNRMWAIQLKVRNAICYGPKEAFDREAYEYRRGKMAEHEAEIIRTKYEIAWRDEIWQSMKPPRVRRTVLVNGVRTKIERETV